MKLSCPVFRCAQTDVAQCTGYHRECDQFYCQTHNKERLCERCSARKQAGLESQYGHMMQLLQRESYAASFTTGVASLLSFSSLLLIAAIVYGYLSYVNQTYLRLFVFSLTGGCLGLTAAIIWYLGKAREYVRSEALEKDALHPGFYDHYQQWQEKIDRITKDL
jgi:hypothetical protein